MKKLQLAAFLAVMGIATSASAILSYEAQQNVEYYLGQGPCPMVAAAPNCGCPCPIECPCVPTCCPANRGIFDGGMCCGGPVIPSRCGGCC